MKPIFGIVLLWFLVVDLSAQNSRNYAQLDSLSKLTISHKQDTNLCHIYCNLALSYRAINMDSVIYWANKADDLSSKIKFVKGSQLANNNLGIAYYTKGKYTEAIDAFTRSKNAAAIRYDTINLAWAFNNIGNVYIDLADYNTTLLYYDSALQLRILLKDSGAVTQSLINFGFVYKELGKYSKALVALYDAVKILEKNNDEQTLAYCYDFIGAVYSQQKKFKYSNAFYQKALTLYLKNNYRSGVAIALNSIGTNYYSLGNTAKGKALVYQAYKIYEDLKDIRQLAIISSTLSEIYTNENKPDSALILAQKSIKYHLQTNNTRQLGGAYLKLSNAQAKLGKYNEAIISAQKAYELTQSTGELNSKKQIAEALSVLYLKQGDFKNAYQYQIIYGAIKDSLINIAGERAIAEMQTKYQTEKKDIEIEKQAIEIKRKQTQLALSIFAIIAVLVVSILLYSRHVLKQKALLNAALLKEQNMRNKAIIEAEEKERVRIAKELHDGIGQQLSATKMNLSALENKIDLADKHLFDVAIQLVDDAVKEVRSISHNMMPNALIKLGLASAVRDFINKLGTGDNLKVNLEIVGLKDSLPANISTVLYRVVQECVTNIVKHAQASVVTIQFIMHQDNLTIMIEDNGVGFDTKNINQFEGIGLKNMISRVEFLNGTVDFDSTIGKGTTTIINVPVTG
ncbi:MAG: tetratricopeptide repeat protein [Bacteroidia bacterium]|nr:tetratricopeptide repeat protein [Bacteroidia bacterium]